MILVDTSVWVQHLRGAPSAAALPAMLRSGRVRAHAWVIGELILGGVAAPVRTRLEAMARVPTMPDNTLLALIRKAELARKGIGWMDAGLVASALDCGAALWTHDQALAAVARDLGVAAPP